VKRCLIKLIHSPRVAGRGADRIGLHLYGNTFGIRGIEHGSENDSRLYAAANPLDRTHKVLALAVNSAMATVRVA
jgi:hypothetical protein